MIGYSASDQLIFDLLEKVKHKTKLNVIGRGNAHKIAERVISESFNLEIGTVSELGFTNYVSSII